MDVEFCQAIAAAVLGDASHIQYVEASDDSSRFGLLDSGAADVVFGTTVSAGDDRDAGVDFARPIFYTGQGFAVLRDSRFQSTRAMGEAAREARPDPDNRSTIETVAEREATICVPTGTTIEQNVADHFTDMGAWYLPLGGGVRDITEAFFSGRCDVLTLDASHLAVLIAGRADAAEYWILPERITREPLAPAVREDDSEWRDLINWIVNGLIAAEELGITQHNVEASALLPASSDIARLLGASFEGGEVATFGFGPLDPQFIRRAIQAVGNYGEIYARTVGEVMPRACTLNALAIDDSVDCPPGQGGIMYALPYR